MKWGTYKSQISTSRQLIVFPFFAERLSAKGGLGVDVGCGSGDLTSHIAKASSASMVGVDIDDESLLEGRKNFPHVHFVRGGIDKNILSTIGLTFDFAFSNCCFCHLQDESVYNTLFDLYSCMKDGAEFVLLVPHIDWAREMYDEIKYEKSGISAVPRYGGRQYFRVTEWYVSALSRCGFEVTSSIDICIPQDDRLEERYRDKVGHKLFSAFVARRTEVLPDAESMKKAFEIAHENRRLEIQLFWQRSLFFWGFVAAALVGYGAAHSDGSEGLDLVFALFGLVCSVVWSAGNRGSKYWQEYWEEKVNRFQHYMTGNIFYDRDPKKPRFLDTFAPRRVSVSKLTMALSDYSVLLWLVLCANSIVGGSMRIKSSTGMEIFAILTFLYCLWFLRKSKSED